MFEITLIAMGKLKEKFYLSAAAEYEKRMKGYCQFRLLELPEVRLPENPSAAEISAGLEKAAELIFSKIPKGAWFLIGSSFGMSPKVKERADFKLSMSPMTFPHHLARVMVLEQLYRAEAIQAGSKYHK